jgi:ribosomal-protein-alanine acetyltransferase
MAALPEGYLIRQPETADMPAVARLEAEVFPDPWPSHLYLQEVGQPLRFQRVACEMGGAVVAYLFACWQVDELHVLKVATHPLFQGRGLATELIAHARAEAERAHARGLLLEVRPSNRSAVALYRHLGFKLIGRRPRYYTDGEDALVMFLTVPRLPGGGSRLQSLLGLPPK